MDMLFIFNTGMRGIPIDFYIFCLPSRENYVMMMMMMIKMMLISQGYALRKIEGSSEF